MVNNIEVILKIYLQNYLLKFISLCVFLGKPQQSMKSKSLIKKCSCMHCIEKQEQINRSKEYWSKILLLKV